VKRRTPNQYISSLFTQNSNDISKFKSYPTKFKYLLIYKVINSPTLATKFNRNHSFCQKSQFHGKKHATFTLAQLSSGIFSLSKTLSLLPSPKNRKILTENDSYEGIQGCNYPRALQFQTKKTAREGLSVEKR
jgi:hypothetical protein